MRNLIFATSVVTEGAVSEVTTEGAFGVASFEHVFGKSSESSELTFAGAIGDAFGGLGLNDYSSLDGPGISQINFVLIRSAEHGGNVLIPFHPNHYHFVRADYQAATTFAASIVIPAPDSDYYDYTIIAVKKGKKFNERNKWTASVRVKSNDTATTIADRLAKYFNDNKDGLGLTVVNNAGTLTFTAVKAGEDFELVPADDLVGTDVTYTTRGKSALGDAAYIKDLADKAAADAGFEYTYEDDVKALYPNYHFNPLAQPDGEDEGFSIFTLRWAEPRYMKTRDEVVHQILQIVVPTDVADDLAAILHYNES